MGGNKLETKLFEDVEKENAESLTLINKALEAARELRDATKEYQVLVDREARLKTMDVMGGRTNTGELPKAETPQEYAKRLVGGKK